MQENLVIALLKKEGLIDWKERSSNSSLQKFYSICSEPIIPNVLDFSSFRNNDAVCFISCVSKGGTVIVRFEDKVFHVFLIGNVGTKQNADLWQRAFYNLSQSGRILFIELPFEHREKMFVESILVIFRLNLGSIKEKREYSLPVVFLEAYFKYYGNPKDTLHFNEKLQKSWCYKEILNYQYNYFKNLSEKTTEELLKLKNDNIEIRKRYYNISLLSLTELIELIEKTKSALLENLLKKADKNISVLINTVDEWNTMEYAKLNANQSELEIALKKSSKKKFMGVISEGINANFQRFYRYSWAGVGGELLPLLAKITVFKDNSSFSKFSLHAVKMLGFCTGTYYTGHFNALKILFTAEINQRLQSFLKENLISDREAIVRNWLLPFIEEAITYSVSVILFALVETAITQDPFPLMKTLAGISFAFLTKHFVMSFGNENTWGDFLPCVQLISHLTGYFLGATLMGGVSQGWEKICTRSRLEEAFPKLVEASNLEGGVTNFHNTIWSPGFWFQEKDNVRLGWHQAQKFHTTECEIIPTGKENATLLCDLPSSMETKPLKF